MTMETTPNVACGTSTRVSVGDWSGSLSNDLFVLTLFMKSACEVVVGIFRSTEILSEISLGALLVCSTDFVETCWLYPSNITLASCLPWHIMWCMQLVYFIIRGKLGSNSHLGQVATIDSLLWNFTLFDGVYTNDVSNIYMAALAVQCRET